MKFLIAGLGSIGRRHLRNLITLGENDIILYRTHLSTLDDEELAEFPVETDLKTALAHRPDAVIISNPTSLHLDVAIPAAAAGCHILLEKPISHNLDRVDEFREAVHQGGGQVLVGYQFRFHPGLQKVDTLLSQSAIGRPLSVRAHWGEHLPGWHPWEDYRQGYSARSDLGGGVALTLSHPLDYLHWLLGDVASIWALANHISDLELDVEDTFEIGLTFGNKTIGSVHLDYNQQPSSHWLEIIGSEGTIRWDCTDGAVSIFRSSTNQGWETFHTPDGFERNDMFQAEMRHFLDVVYHEAQPICTLEDGYQAMILALAAQQSAKMGKLITLK
ncbi:MAG: Gfo/Idh/MocA family oxidoreductase [Chloroflexota bacterium]|nr:Gfo/Idh/MocA family oxidoreductase [Chloroflexota bacterium]